MTLTVEPTGIAVYNRRTRCSPAAAVKTVHPAQPKVAQHVDRFGKCKVIVGGRPREDIETRRYHGAPTAFVGKVECRCSGSRQFVHVSADESGQYQQTARSKDPMAFGDKTAWRVEPLDGRSRGDDVETSRGCVADAQFGITAGEFCLSHSLGRTRCNVPQMEKAARCQSGKMSG